MTQASTSVLHQPEKHGEHCYSSSKPTFSTSARSTHPSSRGGSSWTVSALQRLSCLFSPRRSPSPSADNEKRGLVDVCGTAPPPVVNTVSDIVLDAAAAAITNNNAGCRRGSREGFEQVFRYLDENGDGKISPAELRSCMRALGGELSAEEAEAAVESTDSDGDGFLGFDDFVKLVDAEGEEERTQDLREAFGMYEWKGRGCINPKSLRQMLRRLGVPRTMEECKVMIRRFDLNGDGVLSFDEFRLMMQ